MDPLDDERLSLAGLLFETAAALRREFERSLAEEAGISIQWFEVLLRLVRTPGHRLRMSDLAAQTTLTRSGLTRAVDTLEAAGLVVRQQCPSDGRGAFAVLTPAGADRVSQAVPGHLEHVEKLLTSHLGPGQPEELSDMLRTVRDQFGGRYGPSCPSG